MAFINAIAYYFISWLRGNEVWNLFYFPRFFLKKIINIHDGGGPVCLRLSCVSDFILLVAYYSLYYTSKYNQGKYSSLAFICKSKNDFFYILWSRILCNVCMHLYSYYFWGHTPTMLHAIFLMICVILWFLTFEY